MQRVQGLLRSVDRVQQRSRWLGFPFAVMGKFRDDHGGALTTVIAYNAFFAFFPLLLVVVTVLGFLLGRDSGFQQRLLGSAVADFPIIGDQVQDNIHGLRGSGVGLVIGLVAFAWGARGLTQVAQHAMAEIWNIPGRQRPGFWARQVRGLLLLVVFAVGLAATSLLTWLGSYGGKNRHGFDAAPFESQEDVRHAEEDQSGAEGSGGAAGDASIRRITRR